MAFLTPNDQVTIRAKITDYGRERIATGTLNFSFYGLGDSEIFYPSDKAAIFAPFEVNPSPRFFILDRDCDQEPLKVLPQPKETSFTVVDTANERGPFVDNTGVNSFEIGTAYIKQDTTATFSGNIATFANADNVEAGDFIVVKHSNATASFPDGTLDELVPYSIFKVEAVAGTAITLDRSVGSQCTESKVIVYPSDFQYYDVDPVPYWDEASNDFTETCPPKEDVLVWNMNIVYPETVIGTDTDTQILESQYGSREFASLIPYFNYPEGTQIGVIHYTNSTINNFYGEGFEENTTRVKLPTVSWPTKPDIGVSLVCGEDKFAVTGDNGFYVEYYEMSIEGIGDVVGRSFPDLQTIIIDDAELLAALEPKSGRSNAWPRPNLGLVNIDTEPKILASGDADTTLWVTYVFESSNFLSAIPYQRLGQLTVGNSDNPCNAPTGGALQISIDTASLANYGDHASNSGLGFQYDGAKVLLQKTLNGDRPIADQWREIPLTLSTGFVDATSFSNPFIIDGDEYDAAPLYRLPDDLNIPLNTETDKLAFNEGFFLLGNITTDIKAEVFQSAFYMNLDYDSFNYSQNPSWDNTFGEVRVSEIGIYDSTRRLVAVGKLTEPLIKPIGDNRAIIMTIDF